MEEQNKSNSVTEGYAVDIFSPEYELTRKRFELTRDWVAQMIGRNICDDFFNEAWLIYTNYGGPIAYAKSMHDMLTVIGEEFDIESIHEKVAQMLIHKA
jgi:hypothetical protein